MDIPVKISNLRADRSNTSAVTAIVTVLDNKGPTGLSCEIPPGETTCVDNEHTEDLPIDDFLELRISTTTGANATGAWVAAFLLTSQ
jgi:hypothetical protein